MMGEGVKVWIWGSLQGVAENEYADGGKVMVGTLMVPLTSFGIDIGRLSFTFWRRRLFTPLNDEESIQEVINHTCDATTSLLMVQNS